jgi:nitrite reductase/ring-hydroxylating ferredoxin subunit
MQRLVRQSLARNAFYTLQRRTFVNTTRSMAQVKRHKLDIKSLSSLKNGDKVEVSIDGQEDQKVLLLKFQNQVSAVGSKCTHYGAPLVKGVLSQDGRLTCPWHGACFNGRTGDIENAPAIDNISTYKLSEEGGAVYVEADAENVKSGGRRKPLVSCGASKSAAHVVIVGG